MSFSHRLETTRWDGCLWTWLQQRQAALMSTSVFVWWMPCSLQDCSLYPDFRGGTCHHNRLDQLGQTESWIFAQWRGFQSIPCFFHLGLWPPYRDAGNCLYFPLLSEVGLSFVLTVSMSFLYTSREELSLQLWLIGLSLVISSAILQGRKSNWVWGAGDSFYEHY